LSAKLEIRKKLYFFGGILMKCAYCKEKACYQGKDCASLREDVENILSDDEIKIMRIAAHIESSGYMKLTRIEEVIRFTQMMDFKKIGLAFCIGLAAEAEIAHKIFEKHFEVISICCKVCGIPKEQYNLDKIIDERYEAMCNPIGQAELFNREGTDMNIILGLCIGHDILFTKHCKAPVTTLVVKDRVLAHNPAGALYSGYYRKRLGIS